jgi:hypothetical protein
MRGRGGCRPAPTMSLAGGGTRQPVAGQWVGGFGRRWATAFGRRRPNVRTMAHILLRPASGGESSNQWWATPPSTSDGRGLHQLATRQVASSFKATMVRERRWARASSKWQRQLTGGRQWQLVGCGDGGSDGGWAGATGKCGRDRERVWISFT